MCWIEVRMTRMSTVLLELSAHMKKWEMKISWIHVQEDEDDDDDIDIEMFSGTSKL